MSSSPLISRLKMATERSWVSAACSAMPSARAVLPMLGRAATTMTLPGLEAADDAVEVGEAGRRRR